jgi:ribosomal protein S18 acetylase RimI-like enzyme
MIRKAGTKDIPELMKVVNAAYRGEQSRKGWTSPADIVGGDIRVDEESLMKMFQNPSAIILKYMLDEEIAGCVYLEKQGNDLYLGMLAVWPELQAKDIGKKILEASEDYGRANNLEYIFMHVITRLDKLINWYKRHGYTVTPERKPYPENSKFGTPLEKLEFAVLKKKLVNS